jgi:hypothetical protein
MTEDTVSQHLGRFNIAEIAGSFPATSETLLIDRYLTDREGIVNLVRRGHARAPVAPNIAVTPLFGRRSPHPRL